jgi:hypothetical protein
MIQKPTEEAPLAPVDLGTRVPSEPLSDFDAMLAPHDSESAWAKKTADRIVFQPDQIGEIYEEVERSLTLGDGKLEYGHLAAAVDRISVQYRNAHRLYMTAIRQRKRWERENEITLSALRSKAVKSLQLEKDNKERTKQITDADVTARMYEDHVDEMRAQDERKLDLEITEKSFAQLVETLGDRSRALQTLLAKSRGNLG